VTYNPDFKVTIITSNNSNMVNRAILTMADRYKVVYDLSYDAIFNDPERPIPPVSRSRHFLRWISQKRYTDI